MGLALYKYLLNKDDRHCVLSSLQEDGEEVKEVKVKKRRFMDDDEAATIPGPGTPSPGALTAEKVSCCTCVMLVTAVGLMTALFSLLSGPVLCW